jgi:predicted nucleic acid-binding protein
MIVVSDTSPLNYLVLIGAIDVLPQLFRQVYVPPAVMQELGHPRTPEVVKRWAQAPPSWLHTSAPSGAIAIFEGLDPGEAEAIALAVELNSPAVLIDEKKGRQVAQTQGLVTIGTITVLELAAERELLELATAFGALQATTFQISQDLLDAALARDAARRKTQGPQ